MEDKKPTTCDTPTNFTVPECKEVARTVEDLKIKLNAGPEGITIAFSFPVTMVGFKKEEALKLGALIIETALKL
jgi:hypothetical protein